MGLFGGSKSSSNVTNQTFNTSQTLGDLASGNIQSSGDVTVNGFYGEDLSEFLSTIKSMTNKATESNSKLAGQSIQEVAAGYQSAYSESTGMLRTLRPVLMVAVGVVAMMFFPKILKGFK